MNVELFIHVIETGVLKNDLTHFSQLLQPGTAAVRRPAADTESGKLKAAIRGVQHLQICTNDPKVVKRATREQNIQWFDVQGSGFNRNGPRFTRIASCSGQQTHSLQGQPWTESIPFTFETFQNDRTPELFTKPGFQARLVTVAVGHQ